MLRQKMILPIDEPEMLMAVIQCLAREKMLISSETINVVNQVIEMSFEDGFDPGKYKIIRILEKKLNIFQI